MSGGAPAVPVLQIVPRLPPAIDGVGDYAACLARALAGRGVDSRFLVTDRDGGGARGDAGGGPAADAAGLGAAADFPAETLASAHAEPFARQLDTGGATTVLVHYVNYAYEPRGCPRWLVEGLLRWRRGRQGRRLVTLFHEVYASGPPWRSSFWLSGVQRGLAARLLRGSDGAATTLDLYAHILGRWRPRGEILLAPVLSSIGEPAAVAAASARRPRRLVVFGGPGNRRRAYAELADELAAACRLLDVSEVLDVGAAAGALPARLGGAPVRALGPLPADAVSAVLAQAFAGFLAYPSSMLAKSSVYAAYSSHGLVPVCAWPRHRSQPRPLPAGRPTPTAAASPPFWNPTGAAAGGADGDGGGARPPDPDALAAAARRWYAGHRLELQATWFRDLLGGKAPA